MATALDVAQYIVAKFGSLTALKLQKLVYYSQAWHYTWEERVLFDDPIQAWVNGPVTPNLYEKHQGSFLVDQSFAFGEIGVLDEGEVESIDAIIDSYGKLSGQALSSLTHSEEPWKEARGNLLPHEQSQAIISIESMFRFYSNLLNDPEAVPVSGINDPHENDGE